MVDILVKLIKIGKIISKTFSFQADIQIFFFVFIALKEWDLLTPKYILQVILLEIFSTMSKCSIMAFQMGTVSFI